MERQNDLDVRRITRERGREVQRRDPCKERYRPMKEKKEREGEREKLLHIVLVLVVERAL